jgi:hypothetical protein
VCDDVDEDAIAHNVIAYLCSLAVVRHDAWVAAAVVVCRRRL